MNPSQRKHLDSDPLCGRCKLRPHNAKHKWCKHCQAEYYQERCKAPGYRENLAKLAKEWRDRNPEKNLRTIRNGNLKVKFGITIEQYDEMHAAQRGLCKICGKPENTINYHGKPQRLAVDHCHQTKVNRGLLCSKCNHALERVENIPDWCARAQAYLDARPSPPRIQSLS
jgi:Autographiviridae endonuclease VII